MRKLQKAIFEEKISGITTRKCSIFGGQYPKKKLQLLFIFSRGIFAYQFQVFHRYKWFM